MKNLKAHNITFLFYLIVCFALISFSYKYPDKFQRPRNIIISTFTPVINILSLPSFWLNSAYNNSIIHFDVVEKNKELITENNVLKQWYQKSLLLEQENNRLKNLFDNITKNESNPLLVMAFTDSNSPFSRSILINAGKNKQIEKGQEVVNHQGLVGRIINVFPNSSRVLLITDSTFRLPSRIVENRSRAITKGTNSPQMELMLIENARANVNSNMRIVTSGMGGTFIPNIPVGEIKKDGNNFTVIPYVDFSKLENLVVHRHKMQNILGDDND